jgi:hypothetical protein
MCAPDRTYGTVQTRMGMDGTMSDLLSAYIYGMKRRLRAITRPNEGQRGWLKKLAWLRSPWKQRASSWS